MNYQLGDSVRVVRARRFLVWWPFRRFWLPRPGFFYARAKGSGTVVEVIEPSAERAITNAGGYKVVLKNGTVHYYAETELRSASGTTRR